MKLLMHKKNRKIWDKYDCKDYQRLHGTLGRLRSLDEVVAFVKKFAVDLLNKCFTGENSILTVKI
jgi:hypothetical protein